MKRLLTCLLALGFSVAVSAQPEAPKQYNHFIIPWKSSQHHAYEDKGTFAWKQGGGYFVNDFFALEGSVYQFNYPEKFRYSPYERSGFIKPEDYTVNVLGVGKLPLSNHFALFGKVGPAYQSSHNTEMHNPLFYSVENDPQHLGVTYSTGASVALSPNLEFSVEYLNTQNDYMELEGTVAQMNWNF